MEKKANNEDVSFRDKELEEEMVGILTAISIVSKRLAKKLIMLQNQGAIKGEGGNSDGKNG